MFLTNDRIETRHVVRREHERGPTALLCIHLVYHIKWTILVAVNNYRHVKVENANDKRLTIRHIAYVHARTHTHEDR